LVSIFFSSWGSQFREVVGALVKGSRSFGQKPQQELWSKQQEQWHWKKGR